MDTEMENTSPPSPAKAPVNPVLAATIMLLRDDRGALEVFMVQRHHQIDFATGALVFPGGKTDPADREPALRPHCPGCEGLDDEALALRVSAVRETFEECGVLVARARGEQTLLPESRVRPLETAHRADLLAGRYTMRDLVEQHGLELATDVLVPFAHWITPDFMPKRFDTWFYLVPAPEDQVAAHDGEESVDSVWVKPADAIAEAKAGRRTIIFPTLNNLMKLARSSSVAEAIERARTEPLVTVLPTVHKTDSGKVLRITPEAGYELNEVPMEGRG
jgi:8-oxo-dGTP pyrophosphatase MutT (NUDIX family)